MEVKKILLMFALIPLLSSCTNELPSAQTPISRPAGSPDSSETESAIDTDDTYLWINETEIDKETKFYLGMTADMLLETLSAERINIQTDNPYAVYSAEGIGTHQFGNIFIDATPFYFLLNEEYCVKYISIITNYENIRTAMKMPIEDGMSDKEIEGLYGAPAYEYWQDDILFYLYEFDDFYMELYFYIGYPRESNEREDVDPKLSRIAIFKEIEDSFSGGNF